MTKIKMLCPHCHEDINVSIDARRVERRTKGVLAIDGEGMWDSEVLSFVETRTETSIPEIAEWIGITPAMARSPAYKKQLAHGLRRAGFMAVQKRDVDGKTVRRWRIDPITEQARVQDGRIREILKDKLSVTTSEVADALGLVGEKRTPDMQKKIIAIAQGLGFEYRVDNGVVIMERDTPQHK